MNYIPAMDRIDPNSDHGADHAASPLLGPGDPPPFEILNEHGKSPLILVCDHAANAIPKALDNLGLPEAELTRHIAWDNGAAPVTRLLSKRFAAPAVFSGYSRLVIDCNRVPGHETSVAQESDGTIVPGNLHLTAAEIASREAEIFRPYHGAIAGVVKRRREAGVAPAVLAIHSFTDEMAGVWRPWEISVLWGMDPRIARPLIDRLDAMDGLTVGDNQPYSGREHYGYSIEAHASAAGLPNALIELREDQVRDQDGIRRMARLLGDALAPILDDPSLYRVERFE